MTPIIKWAGGKRQLLTELRRNMPPQFGRYYEPFFGSGALYFDVHPRRGTINDYNSELINLYSQLRAQPNELVDILDGLEREYNALESMDSKDEFYYRIREEYNGHILTPEQLDIRDAALLVFLNKACYNGLYRVNRQGLFNTPSGKRQQLNLVDNDNLMMCSASLQRTSIRNVDFEIACRPARRGDFVYFDSPYYDTFDTYQAGGFPEDEHKRLFHLFERLSMRGVYCLLSNSNTPFITDLYQDYNIQVIPVKRMISRDGQRREDTEVLIKNY